MNKTLKPGQAAPRSGVYEIVGPHGRATGHGRAVTRGALMSPTPKDGQRYALHGKGGVVLAKSGKIIMVSPAKSATTTESWSKAFNFKK